MNLDKLYKLQAELDRTILENEKKRTGKEIDKDLLLNQTILALQVEVAELANETRCFKHWSTKGAESRERLLDEYADILHFALSLGNQLNKKWNWDCIKDVKYEDGYIIETFIAIQATISDIKYAATETILDISYTLLGQQILWLGYQLNFTEEEIEQAYMKKHKENYKRQEEGY